MVVVAAVVIDLLIHFLDRTKRHTGTPHRRDEHEESGHGHSGDHEDYHDGNRQYA